MSEVARGPLGRRRWRMDYIPDKDLFKAVTFSRAMVSKGTPPAVAHARASQYYGVSRADVAHYAAQYAGSMGGKARAGKRTGRRKRRESDNCLNCRHYGVDSTGGWCFENDHTPSDDEERSGCERWWEKVAP